MNLLKKLKKCCLIFIVASLAVYFSTVNAVDSLDNPRDILSNIGIDTLSSHIIRFSLPVSSQPIEEDDYILIDFPNFSGVTEPTSIIGDYSGTPTWIAVSYRVRITGIRVEPGDTISIRGITAYNPPEEDLFDVFIRVSNDPDGTSLKNESHLIATSGSGSITVTAAIESDFGSLEISGYTSPGMFVVFTEGGTVIGTCTAGPTGYFYQIFPGINPTEHIISIVGTDINDNAIPPTVVEVFTRSHEITSVSGLLLPPTLAIDKAQIAKGEAVMITGRATPGYMVKILTEPPVSSFEVYADANGDFSYNLTDTADLDFGDHKVYALVQDPFGTQSLFSITLFFRVIDSTPPIGGGAGCEISKGDINCDGTVDLTDFSILLYYWGMNDATADINYDGNVNLIDFSIMMFYWQG